MPGLLCGLSTIQQCGEDYGVSVCISRLNVFDFPYNKQTQYISINMLIRDLLYTVVNIGTAIIFSASAC